MVQNNPIKAGFVSHPKALTGLRFGRIFVHSQSERVGKHGQTYWNCKCDCGAKKEIGRRVLVYGGTKSCGCLKLELLLKRSTIHGASNTPEFRTWCGIIRRIEDSADKSFPDYGGRGIRMCERWRSSFSSFLEDMGRKPSKEYTIERDDVDGDYEPENCRWIPKKEQQNNTRRSHFVTYRGSEYTLAQFSEMIGRGHAIVRYHLGKNRTAEEIFSKLAVK